MNPEPDAGRAAGADPALGGGLVAGSACRARAAGGRSARHPGGTHAADSDETVGGRAAVSSAASRGRLVVAIALLDDARRVLAARRTSPPAYAGMWEFPGGKVEPGEGELAALARECREELDVEIEIGSFLGQADLASPGWRLRVWFGRILAGTPRAVEGGELRWLSVAELDDVSWLPADLPLVEAMRGRLLDPAPLTTGD
jgi:8-oxo-dGTP diphosphatase